MTTKALILQSCKNNGQQQTQILQFFKFFFSRPYFLLKSSNFPINPPLLYASLLFSVKKKSFPLYFLVLRMLSLFSSFLHHLKQSTQIQAHSMQINLLLLGPPPSKEQLLPSKYLTNHYPWRSPYPSVENDISSLFLKKNNKQTNKARLARLAPRLIMPSSDLPLQYCFTLIFLLL